MTTEFHVTTRATKPIAGQKTGTSGLRKKVAEVQKKNYIVGACLMSSRAARRVESACRRRWCRFVFAFSMQNRNSRRARALQRRRCSQLSVQENWLQSLFLSLADKPVKGATLIVGGDGRFHNRAVLQTICRIAAANGVGKLVVGQRGLFSTPAVSAIIRARGAYGGIILTASHNPGGADGDFGIKYNVGNGGPAPESVTDRILTHTESLSEYREAADLPAIDLERIAQHCFRNADTGDEFVVDVVDSVDEYAALLRSVFDFDALRALFARKDFVFKFDALNGVAGPYAKRIFVEELGASADALTNWFVCAVFSSPQSLTHVCAVIQKKILAASIRIRI